MVTETEPQPTPAPASPEAEPEEDIRRRLTPEEFYGTVGDEVDVIADMIPPSYAPLLREGIKAAVEEGARTFRLRNLKSTKPDVVDGGVDVEFDTGIDSDKVIEAEVIGSWKGGNRFKGRAVKPGKRGRWYRKVNPRAKEPITDDGKFVKPGGVLGLIGIGKKAFQPYRLPLDEFPHGGTVVSMPHPNGEKIIPGKTVVAYVRPK